MAPHNKKEHIKTKVQKLAKHGDIDAHLAAKVSQRLVASVAHFKTKLQTFTLGPLMDKFLDWVPEQYIMQQLPSEIQEFKTYLTRFHRGSSNSALAFIKWVEWAQYENGKDKRYTPKKRTDTKGDEEVAEDDAKKAEEGDQQRKKYRSAARTEMAKKVANREHMQALLQMCLRHNSTRRKEGVHGIVNHMNSLCADLGTRCRDYEELKVSVDASVSYGLVRLIMGMVTENFFNVLLNAHALSSILRSLHNLSPALILSILSTEMALGERMKAFLAHQRKQPVGDAEEEVDPDKLNDASRGERNQRMVAVLFTLIALFSSEQVITREAALEICKVLCFCYVEHRGLRVLSANLLLSLIRNVPQLLEDESAWQWFQVAFFKFHKLDYVRPEGIQLLLLIAATVERTGTKTPASGIVATWVNSDPLEPEMMEKLGSALFRGDHVTECHPSIHPVWDDYFQLIANRCSAGESVKVHLTNVVHNLIAPYRRGAADHPRALLFRKLLERISHLALLNADEFDRAEVVQVASKTVGLGRSGKVSKPTDPATLRAMSINELFAKVHSLIAQYTSIKDSDASANAFRTWIIRELKGCLAVEYHPKQEVPYCNDAVAMFYTAGLLENKTKDERNQNRCIYAFSEAISFTFTPKSGKVRPKTTLDLLSLVDKYLAAEEKGNTRYSTALSNESFRAARDKVEKALRSERRSVLFYDKKDMETMLFLLFLVLSIDDPSNEEAKTRAESIVPDLVRFYTKGTDESLAVFYDLMMALCSSTNAPLQVMPLMAIIRRIATAFLVRFSRFIANRAPLDMLLAPLVEAFKTDEREALRLAMAEAGDEEEEESDSDVDADAGKKRARKPEGADGTDVDTEDDDDDSSSAADSDSDDSDDSEFDEEEEDEEDDLEDDEESEAGDTDMDADSTDDEEEVWAGERSDGEFEEEDQPTDAYLNHLKSMVRDRNDPDHRYPVENNSREKGDILRIVQVASRVGLKLRSPTVIHVFQVLLGVLRNTVKMEDDVVPDAVRSGIETLLLSRNRYFGYFCAADDLTQLLGDIQSYMHKTERAILEADREKNRHLAIRGSMVKRRLAAVKRLAVTVMHYVGFLAQKNHASDECRHLIGEFWKTIFTERGWDSKTLMPTLKKDMYHFRHGFAWVFLPAAMEKALALRETDTAKRAKTFIAAYALIEAFLSRLSGLSTDLKTSVCQKIREFFEAVPLKELFEISHTMLFHYFHCLRRVMEYNSKVGLDTDWVKSVLDLATDDDAIQMTGASVKQLAGVEKLLGVTARIVNTKPCTPFSILHKQHETKWRKKKSRFYKKAREEERKTLDAVLAVRTETPTEDEKTRRTEHRKQLKSTDKNARRKLKNEWLNTLTKEEKLKRRKDFKKAKQERIAENKVKKAELSAKRKASFESWKQKKLEEAAAEEAE